MSDRITAIGRRPRTRVLGARRRVRRRLLMHHHSWYRLPVFLPLHRLPGLLPLPRLPGLLMHHRLPGLLPHHRLPGLLPHYHRPKAQAEKGLGPHLSTRSAPAQVEADLHMSSIAAVHRLYRIPDLIQLHIQF